MPELSCYISRRARESIAHQSIDERFENVKSKSNNFWRHTNILTKLPNIIPTNTRQDLDAQWRQLLLTNETVDMVTVSNGEIFSTTEFWVKVGKIEEFSLISTLAFKLLPLPVSNVACERVFSKVNLLKTDERNRFTVPRIAAHISAKEGLCDSDHKNCTNFQPTKN